MCGSITWERVNTLWEQKVTQPQQKSPNLSNANGGFAYS